MVPGTALQPQESVGAGAAAEAEAALPLPALLFGAPALLGLALALVLVCLLSWRWRRRRLRGAAAPEAAVRGQDGESARGTEGAAAGRVAPCPPRVRGRVKGAALQGCCRQRDGACSEHLRRSRRHSPTQTPGQARDTALASQTSEEDTSWGAGPGGSPGTARLAPALLSLLSQSHFASPLSTSCPEGQSGATRPQPCSGASSPTSQSLQEASRTGVGEDCGPILTLHSPHQSPWTMSSFSLLDRLMPQLPSGLHPEKTQPSPHLPTASLCQLQSWAPLSW